MLMLLTDPSVEPTPDNFLHAIKDLRFQIQMFLSTFISLDKEICNSVSLVFILIFTLVFDLIFFVILYALIFGVIFILILYTLVIGLIFMTVFYILISA